MSAWVGSTAVSTTIPGADLVVRYGHPGDALMAQAVADLQALGADTVDVDEIYADEVGPWSQIVMRYEFKHGLNRYLADLPAAAPAHNLAELIAFNQRDAVELELAVCCTTRLNSTSSLALATVVLAATAISSTGRTTSTVTLSA